MSEEITTTAVQVAQPQRIVVQDDSQFSAMLDTGRFEQLWRIAAIFADSQLVPAHYQKNKSNCFLGLQMAFRLGVDPMMLMQNTYMIGGKPGMEAKFAIALMNTSGLFVDSIDYETEGTDAKNPDYRVRAFATKKSTGKTLYGPWITWAMVKAEGWDSRSGSKWKTIPDQMFPYRGAVFFGRLHCPERLMGMQTREELEDIAPQTDTVTPINSRAAEIASRFAVSESAEIPMTAAEMAEVTQGPQQEPDPDKAPLLQSIFALLAQLAELRGEPADDVLDAATGGKGLIQIDLQDKAEPWLNDLKLRLENELASEA